MSDSHSDLYSMVTQMLMRKQIIGIDILKGIWSKVDKAIWEFLQWPASHKKGIEFNQNKTIYLPYIRKTNDQKERQIYC